MTIRNVPSGRIPATDSSGGGSADSRRPPVKRVEPIAASAASGGVTSPRAAVHRKTEA